MPMLLGGAVTLPGWVELALATPVQFWLGGGFMCWVGSRARPGRQHGSAGGPRHFRRLGAQHVCSLPLDRAGMAPDLYFDSSALVDHLRLVGKFLEARAKGQTGDRPSVP